MTMMTPEIVDLLVKVATMSPDETGALLESLDDDAKQAIAQALSPKWSRFIPDFIVPHPKQLLFLTLPHREILYGGSAGGGKQNLITTPIYSKKGWSTVGDLHPGDIIYDEHGNETTITAEYSSPPNKAYEITFSNGEKIVCDADHQWSVFNDNDRLAMLKRTPEWRAKRKANRKDRHTVSDEDRQRKKWDRPQQPILDLPPVQPRVLNTQQIVDTFFVRGTRLNYSLPKRSPLCLAEKDLPLDPYVLGAWLGDGRSNRGEMTVWEKEDFIIDQFISAGFNAHRADYYGVVVKVPGLTPILREMGLINNKHIPQNYIYSSLEQRLALLQGLNDTDGTVRNRESGGIQFSTSNPQLRDDYCDLLTTLAIEYTVSSRKGKYKKDGVVIECKENFIIQYMTELPAFRLPRKLALQKRDGFRPTVNRVYMTAYREVPIRQMKCFEVDSPQSTFLIGRKMVVTHNTVALLAGALQYADIPGYRSLIVMKNFGNLKEIIDMSREWMGHRKDCDFNITNKEWTFQGGGQLLFRNLDSDADAAEYRSLSVQYIGFDEVTRISREQYMGLKSRARRSQKLRELGVPIRIRAATNPGGGPDWEWVRDRFIDVDLREPKTLFIPASFRDNPYLDTDEYAEMFDGMGAVQREQLMNGEWYVTGNDAHLKETWFKQARDYVPDSKAKRVRIWDIASTVPSVKNRDPDYTAGALCSYMNGVFTIEDITYLRGTPLENEQLILSKYHEDRLRFGRIVDTYIEMGNNSAAKIAVDQLLRGPFAGLSIRAISSNVDKVERARPFATAAENGYVQVVPGQWQKQFFAECAMFGKGNKRAHDDGIDATVYAFTKLVTLQKRRGRVKSFSGKANINARSSGTNNQLFSILRNG